MVRHSGSRSFFMHPSDRGNVRRRTRLLLEALEDRLAPAAFVVTDTSDNPGDTGSLRYAINNLTSGANTITFAPNVIGAVVLNGSELLINKNVSITGPGADLLAISGVGGSRIFEVAAGATVQISGLILENGRSNTGAAIKNAGTLTLTALMISSNTAQGFNGAAGYAGGGGAGGFGGAIYNTGSLTLLDSTLSGNLAVGGTGGAGNSDAVTAVSGGGGGLLGAGSGPNGGAGGGGNAGNSSHKSGYDGGFGGGGGGGITSTSITGTTSGGDGGFGGGGGGGPGGYAGGPYGPPTFGGGGISYFGGGSGGGGSQSTSKPYSGGGGGGGAGLGGAVFNSKSGSLTITNSTISGNTARGGSAPDAGDNGFGYGGGVFNDQGSVVVTSSTIAYNSADHKTGGIYNWFKSGINGGPFTLDSTIVANNTSPAAQLDVFGPFAAKQYNLIGNTAGGFDQTTGLPDWGNSITGVNPLLMPLANYGGAMPTIALRPGSLAVNNGDPNTGLITDQRGAVRGGLSGPSGLDAGVAPDIGAFEASSSYLVTSTADSSVPGTLRGGIEWANVNINPLLLNPTANVIGFDTSGTFGTAQTISLMIAGNTHVGLSALAVSGNVVVNGPTGPGQGVTLARAGSVSDLRLIYVTSSGNLTLNSLTLSGGAARGFSGGSGAAGGGGAAGLGGAIFNDGTLTVLASTLSGNTATGGNGGFGNPFGSRGYGGGGGGLLGPGYLLAGGDYEGGDGGYPFSPFTSGSNGRFGGGGGGAGYFGSTGGAGGNGGVGGGGGGSTFGGAPGTGGFGAGPGGASSGSATGGGGGGAGLGGAIFNYNGASLAITDCTLTGNVAQGGAGGGAVGGKYPGTAGLGEGGAVFNLNGSVTITNSTLAINTANIGGSVFELGDGGTASVTLMNSILANSANGASDFQKGVLNFGSVSTTGDSNLIRFNPFRSGFVGPDTLTGLDPLLGPLANNGGPTQTMALLAGSPALDAGDNSAVAPPAFPGLPFTDQCGLPRISNGTVDLGAFEVQVAPGAPSVSAPASAMAGQAFLVTIHEASSFNGTVTLTTTDPQVATLPSVTVTGGLGTLLGTLKTPGGPWTITAKAGAVSTTSAPISVTPGTATRLAFQVEPVNTPTGVALPAVTVAILDALGNVVTSDNTDSVTVGVASGPGSFLAGSTTSTIVVNGVATFTNLTLVKLGNYTLSAQVVGLYTGPNSTALTVGPLQVAPSSFAGSPSGFSLQFNAPILVNSVTPVLYGQGFGSAAPAPSVAFTQIKDGSGNPITPRPVEGSLVLNAATNSLTFIATNTALQVNTGSPVLPDGTYKVVLHSTAGANGFQALNSGGGFLDGVGSGNPGSGDYAQTFVVNAAALHAPVLWLPDTADGPGQALSAPGKNQVGGGYPVYLDSTGGVTSIFATLTYNTAVLTVTGVTGAGFSLLPASMPGVAFLSYSGPALPAGPKVPVGFITATVPSGSPGNPVPYRAKDLLHLSSVLINGLSFPVATSDGLHLVSYVGDADGNGSYSSNDAVLITRALLNADTGFAAYPLVDPALVADTDGSGFIPADAALQAAEAGVGFATATLANPPIPSGVVFQPIANNVDPSLSVGRVTLEVERGGAVAVPVNIDDAHPAGSTGLIEAHLALTYDPHAFSVSAADVHPGSLLVGGDWTIVSTIDSSTGQIGIALSRDTPIQSTTGGSLVIIEFHSLGEPGGVSSRSLASFQLVASATPNGQYVRTELEDVQGTFTLSPAPINERNGRIDGVLAPSIAPVAWEPLSATVNGDESGGMPADTAIPLALDEAPVTASLHAVAEVSLLSATPESHGPLAIALSALAFLDAVPLLTMPPGSGILAFSAQLAGMAHQVVPLIEPQTFVRSSSEQALAALPFEASAQLRWLALAHDLDEQTRDGIADRIWADTADPRLWQGVRTNAPDSDRTFQVSEPRARAERAALNEYFAQAAEDAGADLDD